MASKEDQARWRAKARQKGKLKRYDKERTSLFECGHFVAVDGEGFNTGPEIVCQVGGGNEYRTRQHEYALLSASDGSELYNPHGRLNTKQCLDFLLDIKANDKNAIPVCFGASYDMTHMLAFSLDREEVEQLLRGDGNPLGRNVLDVTLSFGGTTHDYRLEMRNRKSLSIWRWPAGADKYEQKSKKDGTTTWKNSCKSKVVLWDVIGFFQSSFVEAMAAWLPGDPDYLFIKREKGNRNIFERSELDTIRRYNLAELRCLVAMMERLRDAVRALGLQITRWDGAGAIAGSMLRLHGIKDHMAPSPDEVFEAARCAYSGGHIEACMIGYYRGQVHHYDVNSAYPDQFRHLPSLARGVWRHGSGDDRIPMGFTMVRVEYRFKPGLPFYPLFYRQPNGSILYPERGAGWYWMPEFEAANKFVALYGAIEFRVLEWHHFEAHSNERPFGFIEGYYERRKQIVEESKRTGIPNGEEKTLKLGYNSVYGKAAQQVGARLVDGEIKPPSYFQIEWAGYVTAGCRAKLMEAAIQKPHAIIAFATDGLFSTEPLDLYTPKEKELGAWEYQTHTGITMVMPGVYWLHDEPTEKKPTGLTGYSRGFDKKTMSDTDFIHQAWKRKEPSIAVPSERMLTLGSSLMSDDFWNMRGLFVKTTRSLELTGENSKRCPIAYSSNHPHKGLCPTVPQDLWEDYDLPLSALGSMAYPIAWLGLDDDDDMPHTAAIASADAAFYADVMAAREA